MPFFYIYSSFRSSEIPLYRGTPPASCRAFACQTPSVSSSLGGVRQAKRPTASGESTSKDEYLYIPHESKRTVTSSRERILFSLPKDYFLAGRPAISLCQVVKRLRIAILCRMDCIFITVEQIGFITARFYAKSLPSFPLFRLTYLYIGSYEKSSPP